MQLYLLFPLAACVASALLVATTLGRDRRRVANRVSLGVCSGVLFWSICEVLWNTADRPEAALALMRLSTPGWCFLGPLALHAFGLAAGPGVGFERVRPWLPGLYATSLGFAALSLLGPGLFTGAERTGWGWSYHTGPLYPLFFAFTLGCALTGLRLGLRGLERASEQARDQLRVMLLGGAIPTGVASLTDGLLPMLGFHPPRLGSLSFAALGAATAWALRRWTDPVWAPGDLAREIFEGLPDGVALVDGDGLVRRANPALGRLFGASTATLPGTALAEWVPGVALDHRDGDAEQELQLGAAGGGLPVSVATRPLLGRARARIGTIVSVRDLSEVAELRRRAITAGRQGAVGELAAGVAHEVNNPLAFTRSNLGSVRESLARLRGELPPDLQQRLEESDEGLCEALDGVDRVAEIVEELGCLAPRPSFRDRIDLNGLLERTLRLTAPERRPGVSIERAFGDVPEVHGSPQELQQVFVNLVVNALQAVKDGGRIRVSSEPAPGGVLVTLEDDGPGISPEVLDRVFDPFFTTRETGEGKGLGLAVSYHLVRHHGGDLFVESDPERGTRVRVLLPEAPGGADPDRRDRRGAGTASDAPAG